MDSIERIFENGVKGLKYLFPEMYKTILNEISRQEKNLMLVASSSIVHPSTLLCMGVPLVNVTAEGYPSQRYHAGCRYIDEVEEYAIELAKRVFRAQYANVQPHSATSANEIVLFSLLEPGDVILGMDLRSGGHLSHGANVSFSGQYFKAVKYGLNENYEIDMEEVERLAIVNKPKVIICGTTAYARKINFRKFREIADKVNAILVADISHIAGLVVSGLHESPIDYAHITTTCTHKQLFGPRGGLILSGKDYNTKLMIKGNKTTLEQHFQRAVFPFFQGAPAMNLIAGKAMALKYTQCNEFVEIMEGVLKSARLMADYFMAHGYKVISKGTDTHLFLIDLNDRQITGKDAEKKLELCGIIVNKNGVPNKNSYSKEPMGIRIGTNSIAQRKLSERDIIKSAELIDLVLKNIECIKVESNLLEKVKKGVAEICENNPIDWYR